MAYILVKIRTLNNILIDSDLCMYVTKRLQLNIIGMDITLCTNVVFVIYKDMYLLCGCFMIIINVQVSIVLAVFFRMIFIPLPGWQDPVHGIINGILTDTTVLSVVFLRNILSM